jgi:ornithine carbamoyltransferase
MVGAAMMGMNCTVLAPEDLHPEGKLVETVKGLAEISGAEIRISDDPDAVEGAHVIYTDVWASMGEEEQMKERIALLEPYRVDAKMLERTGNPDVLFMHCLPAVKGNEVTFDVIEGPNSVVWDEAENRKHTIKALMVASML